MTLECLLVARASPRDVLFARRVLLAVVRAAGLGVLVALRAPHGAGEVEG